MAISARLIRSLLPALVSAGLVLAACSSDSDGPSDPGQVDDPKPGDGGSDSSGGGTAGAPIDDGEAGTPPSNQGGTNTGVGGDTDPGVGGTPPDPGTAGAGGEAPSEPTETFLHGKAIYTEKCVICHQADLGGTGFYPNISADTVNGIGTWSDEQIGDAITKGEDPEGGKLCAFMVPVPELSAGDLADLIEYLRGAPPSNRKITAACPQ